VKAIEMWEELREGERRRSAVRDAIESRREVSRGRVGGRIIYPLLGSYAQIPLQKLLQRRCTVHGWLLAQGACVVSPSWFPLFCLPSIVYKHLDGDRSTLFFTHGCFCMNI
jgi:hypothetical protein